MPWPRWGRGAARGGNTLAGEVAFDWIGPFSGASKLPYYDDAVPRETSTLPGGKMIAETVKEELARAMPRTMLRYAIERMEPERRRYFMER